MIQNGQLQKLIQTKHFNLLKQLVVRRGQLNQVKDLVDSLVSHNWWVLSQYDDKRILFKYCILKQKHKGKNTKHDTNNCYNICIYLNLKYRQYSATLLFKKIYSLS